jgi:hypothetical protein
VTPSSDHFGTIINESIDLHLCTVYMAQNDKKVSATVHHVIPSQLQLGQKKSRPEKKELANKCVGLENRVFCLYYGAYNLLAANICKLQISKHAHSYNPSAKLYMPTAHHYIFTHPSNVLPKFMNSS